VSGGGSRRNDRRRRVGAALRRGVPIVFARSTTIHAHPSYIDAGIKHVRDIVMPALADIDGCLGLSLLIDRGSGRCIATSSRRAGDVLRSREGMARMLRDEAARMVHATTDVADWDIAAMHRAHHASRGSCCRVTWVELDPAQIGRAH